MVVLAVMLGASGCGGSSPSHPPAKPTGTSSTAAAKAAVRYSPAKRRYLHHFKTSCKRVNRRADAMTRRIKALTDQLAKGDTRSVRRLANYFHKLARTFAKGLLHTKHLGPPPEPDSAAGVRYLAADAAIVLGIQRIGDAVATGNSSQIAPATAQIRSATQIAKDAGSTYGFPQCGSAPENSAPIA